MGYWEQTGEENKREAEKDRGARQRVDWLGRLALPVSALIIGATVYVLFGPLIG